MFITPARSAHSNNSDDAKTTIKEMLRPMKRLFNVSLDDNKLDADIDALLLVDRFASS